MDRYQCPRDNGEPLATFKPGVFEPSELKDSAPLSLYLQCASYIIKNISSVQFTAKIPAEVTDNLLEVFRYVGSKTATSRTLSQLSADRCRLNDADLSQMDITNEELLNFVGQHSKTIRKLVLSENKRLTTETLFKLIDTLVKVKNPERLHREVTVYQMRDLDTSKPMPMVLRDSEFIWKKVYHNGLMTSYTRKNMPKEFIQSILGNGSKTDQTRQEELMVDAENSCGSKMDVESEDKTIECGQDAQQCSNYPHVLLKNPGNYDVTYKTFKEPLVKDFDLHQAMGLFNQPDFVTCYMDSCCEDTSHFLPHCEHSCGGNDINFDLYTSNLLQNLKHLSNNSDHLEAGNQSTSSVSIDEDDAADVGDGHVVAPSTSRLSSAMDEETPPTQSVHFRSFYRDTLFYHPVQDPNNRRPQEGSSGSGGSNSALSAGASSSSSNFFKMQRRSTGGICESAAVRRQRRLARIGGGRHSLNNAEDDEDEDDEFDDDEDLELSYRFNNNNQQASQQQYLQRPNGHRIMKATGGEGEQHRQSPPPQPAATAPLHHQQSASSSTDSASSPNGSNFPSSGSASACAMGMFDNFRRRLTSGMKTRHGAGGGAIVGVGNNAGSSSNATSSSCPSIADWVFYTIRNQEQMRSQQKQVRFRGGAGNPNRHAGGYHAANKNMCHDFSSEAAMHPPASSSSLSSSPDIYFGQDLEAYDGFKPYEYSVFMIEKRICVVEIRTWEECPLETIVMTESALPREDMNDYSLRTPLNFDLFLSPHLTNLRNLVIHNWPVDVLETLMPRPLDLPVATRIEHLDLSGCQSYGRGEKLVQLTNLKSLVLHNVTNIHHAWDNICKLKTLRHLDISNMNDNANNYDDPVSRLRILIDSLPNLVSLDISGTNLAGFRGETILGLEKRVNNPLEFLGLLHTNHDACYRHNIPALKIAGDSFENYILTACEAYIDRVDMLRKSLNELFQLFRYESGRHNLGRALKILVCALGRHPGDKLIQVAASATLFYIVKSDEAKWQLGKRMKQLIVSRLLDAMQTFRYDQTMLRNGCLNLIHFRIPQDVISEYTRLADILLYIVTNDEEDFVQRLGIYLLNSLACQVDGEQKTIVGNLGAIEKMLQLIEARFNRDVCDEVMETAWSTMWNVTDETPINCERFLNNNGMEFFVNCMERFPNYPELLRNMMGLLGNVSECPHLRYRLMKQEYISRFIRLLDSTSDGIEVSYNSAGILAHIASDGPVVWDRYLDPVTCNRDVMLQKMEAAILRWEINSKRNINYRSFEPILRLLRVQSISWQAQYWAVWALANLTRVHCSKYCQLLEKDGGLQVLRTFITAQRPDNFELPKAAKCLAVVTLLQYFLYTNYGNLSNLEKSAEIESCFYRIKGDVVESFLKQNGLEAVNAELKFLLPRHQLGGAKAHRHYSSSNDWFRQLHNMHQHHHFSRFNQHLMRLREQQQRDGLEAAAAELRMQHQQIMQQQAAAEEGNDEPGPAHQGPVSTCPACRLALAAGERAELEARQQEDDDLAAARAEGNNDTQDDGDEERENDEADSLADPQENIYL